MNRILLTAVTCWLGAATCLPLHAQVREFPYKAKIVVDEAYVRSGAGDAFYPTQLLKKDATVNVRRHDPGGWYMIDPPKGSFSWIPEKHVRRLNADSGEVLESNVVVFVGSSFGDETHVWQRRLMAGEKVRILDQKTVDSLSGPRSMYQIEPPVREYRWIPGSTVIPVNEQDRSQHDRDPYSVPSNVVRRDPPAEVNSAEEKPAAATGPLKYSPSRQLTRLKQIRAEQRQLAEIDQRFRSMIQSDPASWDLNKIEQDYRRLQDNATHKPLEGQIDLRYPAIRRYRERKAKLDELNRLTSETDRRDAELLAQQMNSTPTNIADASLDAFGFGTSEHITSGTMALPSSNALSLPPDSAGPGAINWSEPVFDMTVPTDSESVPGFDGSVGQSSDFPIGDLSTGTNSFPTGGSISGISLSQEMESASIAPPTAGPTLNIPAQSRFIGAGFITRAANGDGFLLTNRSGKVLAHLKADASVDLAKHIGKSVGLHGKRYFDTAVQKDRIEVSGLESVRLK